MKYAYVVHSGDFAIDKALLVVYNLIVLNHSEGKYYAHSGGLFYEHL